MDRITLKEVEALLLRVEHTLGVEEANLLRAVLALRYIKGEAVAAYKPPLELADQCPAGG